jgi:Mn2+/Fe2+ NRAMP family transporter
VTSTALLTVIAITGTTSAPWQLFFQQSNVIDKRITTRWMRNERLDTIIGAFLTNIEAAGLIVTAAVFVGTTLDHAFVDVLASAESYTRPGHLAMGVLLAFILLNASIIGACTVSLSLSYAFGDTFGIQHSLHSRLRDAKAFYGSYATPAAGPADAGSAGVGQDFAARGNGFPGTIVQ